MVLIQFSDFGLGRGLYIAKALSLLGISVTIVTNEPVYSDQRLSKGSMLNFDAKVIEFRIPYLKALHSSILGRLIAYVLFTLFSFFALMENSQPDTLYSRGPQPFTEISCILYKVFNRNVRIISDTTDLWPDTLEYVEMNRVLKGLMIQQGHAINNLVYSRVDAIVTLNEELSKVLRERFGRATYVIYGVIDLDRFKSMSKSEALEALPLAIRNRVAGKFVILYAGLLGPFQNPSAIVDVAKKIADDEEVIFLIAGIGPLKASMEQEVKKCGLNNVLFLETQPFGKMPLIYNSADLFLLTYAPIDFLRIGLPKKFIEYAACGKPILCMSPPCVASDLCVKWEAGYRVDSLDAENAVNLIRFLKKNEALKVKSGENARQLAEALFSPNHAAETLKEIVCQC